MLVKYISDIKRKSNEKIIYWRYRCDDNIELWELALHYISLSVKDYPELIKLVGEPKISGMSDKFKYFFDGRSIVTEKYA